MLQLLRLRDGFNFTFMLDLWIPTPCLNAFWHAVPTSLSIFITLYLGHHIA